MNDSQDSKRIKPLKLQVLLSAMNQKDHGIVKRAKITTSAVIVNQSSEFKCEKFKNQGEDILFLTFPEKGIGLSRNSALMRSDADIVLFADDDVVYAKDYEKAVLSEFANNPRADMIIFNMPSLNPSRDSYYTKRNSRVRRHNSMRYATPRIAVKTHRLKNANVYFSLLFGGGAKYSAGEDSLFVYQCIKNGLKVYASPEVIGFVSDSSSTWFEGYTDKFFRDKGAFFKNLSPSYAGLLGLQYALRKRSEYRSEKTFFQVLRLVNEGIRGFS